MTHDRLSTAIRDAYDGVAPPPYPASAVASARLVRGPRPVRPLLRLGLAAVGGLLAGALFASIPSPAHDRVLALLAHPAATSAVDDGGVTRTVSLDEARRLATFPVVVPQGVPVDSVRIGSDRQTVQMIVRPRTGDRVLMVERPAAGYGAGPSSSWTSGSTAVTVIGPPDDSVLRRLRAATGAP